MNRSDNRGYSIILALAKAASLGISRNQHTVAKDSLEQNQTVLSARDLDLHFARDLDLRKVPGRIQAGDVSRFPPCLDWIFPGETAEPIFRDQEAGNFDVFFCTLRD